MRIGVTGASGQLGSAVLKALGDIVPPENLVGLARTPEKASHHPIKILPGDYDDPAGLKSSLQGIGRLLLVSGNAPPELRIQQHRNVLEAARASGVERVVYTSVQGADEGTAFSPVVQSNRQTEKDLMESGLDWIIGRNGIYIEPDVEYIATYQAQGGITNCAGEGRCGYTTRPELGYAYARLLIDTGHSGQVYNLHGEPITQAQLAEHLSRTFGTPLAYTPVSVEEYRQDRIRELGDFLGGIIAGIYQGIREGYLDNPSHYSLAAGREHQSWQEYFASLDPIP